MPVHPLRSGKHALCFGALLACVTGARLGREDQERLSGIVLSGVSLPAVPEPSDGIHVHRLDRQALFDHFMRIGKLPETFDRDSRMASLGVCAPPTSPGAAPSPSSAGGSVLTHCPVLPFQEDRFCGCGDKPPASAITGWLRCNAAAGWPIGMAVSLSVRGGTRWRPRSTPSAHCW